MGWFADDEDVYTVDVLEHETKLKGVVTCRRLNAKQHAEVQDAMFDAEEGEGSARWLIVKNVIVKWDLEVPEGKEKVPYSEAALAALSPVVFQQIYAGIKREDVNPFVPAFAAIAELRREQAATPSTEPPAPAEPADDPDA